MGSTTYDMAQRFERTASTLPKADLPQFYDDAARELIRHGDPKRAAAMFANARAAEDTSDAATASRQTSDAAWLDLHREFAAAGALGTKSVADFVKSLKTRATPQDAVATLSELAVLRARAGQAPWPRLPKQLSAFAEAAGVDTLTAHRDLLIPLCATEAVAQAAAQMWTAWRPILVRVCADSPQLRGLLLNLLPVPESLDGWWLELLNECGAIAGLVGDADPGAEPVGGRAAWLERTVWHPNLNATLRRRSRISKLLPPQISDLIVRMAPALRADGVPVRLEGPDYWTKRIDARVVESCLLNGVRLAPLSDKARLGLDLWLHDRRPEDDLAATVKDPRFEQDVIAWARKREAAQLWTIPALRPHVGPLPDHEAAPHPLDGLKIYSAVHEFGVLSTGSSIGARRLLASLRALTTALREGTAASADPHLLRLGETADLAGRVEWIVLRAIAPSTPPDRRELLIALLGVWAESVLADPAIRIFHGTAEIDRDHLLAADEHGVAMHTYSGQETPLPFTAFTYGSPDAEPLCPGQVHTLQEFPVGWGSADRLRELVALLNERGAVSRDRKAPATLSDATGITTHAAAMALAGLLGAGGYYVPFMGAEERKALGITAKQAEAGRQELAALRDRARTELLLGILPDDPADLWRPGGIGAVAERLAGNWPATLPVY